MKKDNIQSIAKNVVEFEINALKKLKKILIRISQKLLD